MSADDDTWSVSTAVVEGDTGAWHSRGWHRASHRHYAMAQILLRRVYRAEVHGVARFVFQRWTCHATRRARKRERLRDSADWNAVRLMSDCLRDHNDPETFLAGDPAERSEVQELRHQICECAKAHKAQAQELEVVHQETETFASLEERFEELQKAARKSDCVGEAVSEMILFLKSNPSVNSQDKASKKADMSSLPELEELWTEIERTCSHLRASICDAMTQTLAVGDAVAIERELSSGTTLCSPSTRMPFEHDWASINKSQSVDVMTQTEASNSESKAVATELVAPETTNAVSHEHEECERVSIEQQRILALEVQLHELGEALKASDMVLEKVREERDVLGDEVTFFQTLALEKDAIERDAEAEEEARIQQSLEISDLIEMIYRKAPWVTCSKLNVKGGSSEMESLRNLCTLFLEDIKQWRSNCDTAMLDRTRFESLVSESEGMINFLCEQGPSAGFVETDLREIQNWKADISEAAANVERIMMELLTTWKHVGAHECANIIKRRQRTLHLLLERLGGSPAPRHKVKALKTALTQFLEAEGVRKSESTSQSHHPSSLRPSPQKTYASSTGGSAAAGRASSSLSSLCLPRYLESTNLGAHTQATNLGASTSSSPGNQQAPGPRQYSPDRRKLLARTAGDGELAARYYGTQGPRGQVRPGAATGGSVARSGRVAPVTASAMVQTSVRRQAQMTARG